MHSKNAIEEKLNNFYMSLSNNGDIEKLNTQIYKEEVLEETIYKGLSEIYHIDLDKTDLSSVNELYNFRMPLVNIDFPSSSFWDSLLNKCSLKDFEYLLKAFERLVQHNNVCFKTDILKASVLNILSFNGEFLESNKDKIRMVCNSKWLNITSNNCDINFNKHIKVMFNTMLLDEIRLINQNHMYNGLIAMNIFKEKESVIYKNYINDRFISKENKNFINLAEYFCNKIIKSRRIKFYKIDMEDLFLKFNVNFFIRLNELMEKSTNNKKMAINIINKYGDDILLKEIILKSISTGESKKIEKKRKEFPGVFEKIREKDVDGYMMKHVLTHRISLTNNLFQGDLGKLFNLKNSNVEILEEKETKDNFISIINNIRIMEEKEKINAGINNKNSDSENSIKKRI